MMAGDGLQRRHLTVAALGGVAAGLFGRRLGRILLVGDAAAVPPSEALLGFCRELGCPPALGRTCRDALPTQATTVTGLTQVILADVISPTGPQLALAEAIRQRSRADFRENRLVTVEGWVLSLTETRLYALSAILRGTNGAA